ncbi:MAG: polysaccharide ABC transporter ATP-binding protein [Actinomycetota bacterium]
MSSPLVAVEVTDLSKRFRKSSEPSKTLKERLLTWRQSTVQEFHALHDVNFEIGVGETFGILGHNGSGKSTLLKCIAGTIRPTTGSVRVRGQLSALLELGAGFHPDLTGRENIFLNGSILGFSRARIEEIFDEIVDFSGLSEFIDTQVKHYSSGMYARLGFAVAVNLEPDVLLIDEVLAVGDEAFQAKCVERVKGFQEAGRTICLVTHSPDMVRNLCHRAMVLDHGDLLHVGDVGDAISIYRRSLDPEGYAAEQPPAETEAIVIDPEPRLDISIEDAWVEPPASGRPAFQPGDTVGIGLRFRAPVGEMVRARLHLHADDGVHFANISSWDVTGTEIGPTDEVNEIRFVIDEFPLTDGHYTITMVLQNPAETVEYDRSEGSLSFDVFTGQPIISRLVLKVGLETNSGRPSAAGS